MEPFLPPNIRVCVCVRLSKTTRVTERDGEHEYITRLRHAMKIAIFSPANAIRLTRPLIITIAPPEPVASALYSSVSGV